MSHPRPASAGNLRVVGMVFAALALIPVSLQAQGIRGWVSSTVQMVELRPVAMDTVAFDATVPGPDGQYTSDGRLVSCVLGVSCIGYRALDEARTIAASQDISLVGWGFGVQGLSFTALLRTRQHGGSDVLWPRSDDSFDALLAYAQLVRGGLRFRAGRQEVRSGLGFPAFDGGAVSWTVGRSRLEAYGGRSLARGLRDPANEALRGLEDFLPDRGALLFGTSLQTRFDQTSLTARYHREILTDRSALEGERASVDFSSVFPRVRIAGSLDYDLGFQRLGKGHLTATVPLAENRWILEASARRYVPYFSLSTIWGYFEPVSYEEAALRLSWGPTESLAVWASGGVRRYGDTQTEVINATLKDEGRRATAGVRWKLNDVWTLDSSYRLEWGPGSFLSSGDGAVSWAPSERMSLRVHGTTFQQFEEFRLGEGRALGGGVSGDVSLTDRVWLGAGASVLRHRGEGGTVGSPWNQERAWTTLRILVGDDPGMRRRR